MSIQDRPLHGSAPGEKRRHFYVDFYNQWPALLSLRRSNWYDFAVLVLECEHSPYKGSSEITIGLLGFTLVMTYVWDWSFTDELTNRRDKIIAEMKARTGATEVRDPLGALDSLRDDKR